MAQYFGLRPTTRRLSDPVGQVVELVDAHDSLYTAILFDPAPPVPHTVNVELVMSFLEYPMVVGLAGLALHDVPRGWFAYPTGPSWLTTELAGRHATTARAMGPRAALEFLTMVADILGDAAPIGQMQACFSHGDLRPSRVAIGHDGVVQVIGYGIPVPPEHIASDQCAPEALRYAPPERLARHPEDHRADVYSLAAMAFELAAGKPLFAGTADAIRERVRAGDAPRALRGAGLPRPLVKLLGQALAADPADRPGPAAFADQARHLLESGHTPGATFREILEKHGGTGTLSRKRPSDRPNRPAPPDTGALPFQTIGPERPPPLPEPTADPEPETPPPLPSRARWEQVTSEAERRPTTPEEDTPPPRRRRRRLDPAALETPRSRRARRRSTLAADATESAVANALHAPPLVELAAQPTRDGEEPPDAPPEVSPGHPSTLERTGETDHPEELVPQDPTLELPSETTAEVLASPLLTEASTTHTDALVDDMPVPYEPVPRPRRRLTRSGMVSMTSRRRRSASGEE